MTPSPQDNNEKAEGLVVGGMIPSHIIQADGPQAYQRLSSSSSMLEYFSDDINDEAKMVKNNDIYFFYEHTVNFSLSQYAETLLIHLLAYTILGPFICIYTLIFRKSAPWLMSNLQFSRIKSRGFMVQHMGWVFNCIYFYLYFSNPSKVADYPLMMYLIIAYIVRCSSIAGKYATYPANQYRQMKEVFLTDRQMRGEMMLMSWWQQTPRVIALELKNTMKRLEIDDALFKLAFLADINEITLKDMAQIVVNNEKHKNGGIELVTTNQTLNIQKHLKYYDGKVILEFIIRQYNKNQGLSPIALGSIFLLTFFFVMSPAIFRAIVGQTMFGNSAIEYICFGGNGFMIFFLVFITTLFFVAGIRDMKRRLFILQQLG